MIEAKIIEAYERFGIKFLKHAEILIKCELKLMDVPYDLYEKCINQSLIPIYQELQRFIARAQS